MEFTVDPPTIVVSIHGASTEIKIKIIAPSVAGRGVVVVANVYAIPSPSLKHYHITANTRRYCIRDLQPKDPTAQLHITLADQQRLSVLPDSKFQSPDFIVQDSRVVTASHPPLRLPAHHTPHYNQKLRWRYHLVTGA